MNIVGPRQCRSYLFLLLLFAFCLYCGYETVIGVFQIIDIYNKNHSLFALTGTFKNPGPYGGFLSICISLLISYCTINKDICKNSTVYAFIYWLAVFVSVFAIIVLPSTQSRSAILALICSMLLLYFKIKTSKGRWYSLLNNGKFFILIGIIVIGTTSYFIKKQSADGRLFMDKICLMTMKDNRFRGVGAGNFGGVYGKAQLDYFKRQIEKKGNYFLDWRAINETKRISADCPDNAFNEYLFIGVESGIIIMLFFIGMVLSSIYISLKRGTIWCYGLTSFSIFSFFSYPLHVVQLQVIFIILVVACLFDGEIRHAWFFPCSLICIFFLILVIEKDRSKIKNQRIVEDVWKRTEHWYRMGYYDYIIEDCDSIFDYMKNNKRFLFVYGHSLNKTGLFEKSDMILKIGTEKSCDPMFWNVMGNNSLALGKYREAEERYLNAFYMVPNRLYPLYLLSKLYYIECDTTRFLDMAEMVEAFIPKIESLATERLKIEIKELKSNVQVTFNNVMDQ